MDKEKLDYLKSIGEVSVPKMHPGVDFTYKGKTIYIDSRPREESEPMSLEEFKLWIKNIEEYAALDAEKTRVWNQAVQSFNTKLSSLGEGE